MDLTKRGLEAHLQKVVLDLVVDEQMDLFETALRQRLGEIVKSITIGHVEHVADVLKLRQAVLIEVNVNHHFDDMRAQA